MITLTGKPNCSYCTMLENMVKKIGVEYTKVDVEQNEEFFEKVKEGGNRMPACIFVGDARYAVSNEQPVKVPQISQWLKEQGAL